MSQTNTESNYSKRGVSFNKEDVHHSIEKLDKGLFKNSFCKIYPDIFTNDPSSFLISHADGAGTKSLIAYLYWKETGDVDIWKNISQDAIVMNTDDLLCTGAITDFCYTSTIGRNKNLIPREVLSTLINSTNQFINKLNSLGTKILLMGGETADVGDVVRTIIVDGSITTRLNIHKVIDNSKIRDGDVIIGFASYGKTIYEDEYNSGIGSNGLTSARHDLLNKHYEISYPESFDPNVDEKFRYNGSFRLTDIEPETGINIGKLLLSPTRTYLPVVKEIFEKIDCENIHGIIHCTGGGQTKVLNFIDNLCVIKDNLFDVPPIFKLIKKESKNSWKEMYQVFNMGHRLEMYVDKSLADSIIKIASNYELDAKIIGRVETSKEKKLIIRTDMAELIY